MNRDTIDRNRQYNRKIYLFGLIFAGWALSVMQTEAQNIQAATEPQSAAELIRNGTFEQTFSAQGVALHWGDNSDWAPVVVDYAAETTAPHSGGHAQKMECTSFKGGAVQFVQFNIPVTQNAIYRIVLWMKGTLDSPVEVVLRKGSAPYTTYASQRFRVHENWEQYSFDVVSEETDPEAMFIVRFASTGMLWLDDISCRRSGVRSADVHLKPPAGIIPSTYFGMHIHRNNEKLPWPEVPFGALRLWDAGVSWPYLEPERDKWDFSRLDVYINLATQHHVEVLLPLGLTPTWASARPEEKSAYNSANVSRDTGWAAEPRNFEDWDSYVRKVATHCRGRVHQYEIWNEPNAVPFFSGTVDQLVELTKRAAEILKEVDPANTLVSSSVVGDLMYLEDLFGKGGARPADVVGYHFYVWPDPPEKMVPPILQVRDAMKRYGLASLPLWNTEAGWNIESKVSPPPVAAYENRLPLPIQEAGDYIARAYLLNWAAGVERYYFYAWDNGLMGLIEKDGTLKPGARAYAEIYDWLVGSQMVACDADEAGTWTVKLIRKNGSYAIVVWNPIRDVDFEMPPEWKFSRIRDLTGATYPIQPKNRVKCAGSPILLEQ